MSAFLFQDSFESMGTNVSIDIVCAESEGLAVKNAFARSRELFEFAERRFSRFDSKSELSFLNSRMGASVTVSQPMFNMLEIALRSYRETDGWFDPRVLGHLRSVGYIHAFRSNNFESKGDYPGRTVFLQPLAEDVFLKGDALEAIVRVPLDLSGIVKGYTVREVSYMLHVLGFANHVVDAGGDMMFSGKNKEGSCWKVDIEGTAESTCLFKVDNACVATSGITRRHWEREGKRYHHLINPKNPEFFSFTLQTVTVFSSDMVQSDIWAKTLFLTGLEEGLRRANEKKIAAVFLSDDSSVSFSHYAEHYTSY